ncbi:hypothetical protein ACOMHN_005991 [Nucella lapillus]
MGVQQYGRHGPCRPGQASPRWLPSIALWLATSVVRPDYSQLPLPALSNLAAGDGSAWKGRRGRGCGWVETSGKIDPSKPEDDVTLIGKGAVAMAPRPLAIRSVDPHTPDQVALH